MPRHRHKRATIPPAAPNTAPVETRQVDLPESNGHVGEQAVETLLTEIPRDNPVPTGKPLLSPGIPDTWEMRELARELNTSKLRTGPETTLEALRALCDTNQPAYLFQRYGRLTRIVPDEHGLPTIADVPQGALKGMLARAAIWQVEVKLRNGKIELQRILPPGYIVEDIASHGDWPFWALKGISAIPILRKDGSLHSTPGYDEITGYWYEPSGALVGTAWDIAKPIAWAVRVLEDWLADFPFAGPAERSAEKAHALALFLTLLSRSAIDGNVPLALIVATKPRTGKTLLVECIMLAILGSLPALTSVPADEAEMRKLLASLALHGRTYLVLDNINGPLDSASLASVLTSGRIADRILKSNDVLDMEAGFVMAATGNQLEASTELLARSYRCLLDAGTSRPQDRKSFRHEDILGYTRDHRHEILQAGFTMLSGFIQAGKPGTAKLPRKGGYEGWVKLIGGTLAYAGIPGFLQNERELSVSADESETDMERFLSALLQVYRHKIFKTTQVFEEAGKTNSPLSEALPAHLAEVQAIRSSFIRRAGLLLKKQQGVHYGSPDMWIQGQEDAHTKSTVWCVMGGSDSEPVAVPPDESIPLTTEENRIARKLIEGEAGNA